MIRSTFFIITSEISREGTDTQLITFSGRPASIAAFLMILAASMEQLTAFGCGETMIAFLVFNAIRIL